MEIFSFRFTSYSLLLVCTLWSVADCSTTAPGLRTAVTASTGSETASQNTETSQPSTESTTALITTTTQPITTPQQPGDVIVANQTENSITIEFSKVDNVLEYTLNYSISGTVDEEKSQDCNATLSDNKVLCTVINLQPAQKYNMNLYTVVGSSTSQGRPFFAYTAPSRAEGFEYITQNETSITLQWKNEKRDDVNYILEYEGKKETLASQSFDDPAEYVVTDLKHTTVYNFVLQPVFHNITGEPMTTRRATAPLNAEGFGSVAQTEDSITLRWNPVSKVTSYILLSDDRAPEKIEGNEKIISSLRSETLYRFTLLSVFENVNSSGAVTSAPTAPQDVFGFRQTSQTETDITLEWFDVYGVENYVLTYGAKTVNVPPSNPFVKHIVPTLQPGTLYNFTLRTEFKKILSRGKTLLAATDPSPVSSVKVLHRDLTSVILQWETSIQNDWFYSVYINGKSEEVKSKNGSASYNASSLEHGRVYEFRITTLFKPSVITETFSSKPYENKTVTKIDCASVYWSITETTIEGNVNGAFTKATASNGTEHQNSGIYSQVKFTNLYPGANYTMELMYEQDIQCTHAITMVPPRLTAECKDSDGGYSTYIEWNSPYGVWDFVEVYIDNIKHEVGFSGELSAKIPHLQPAKQYEVSIYTKSGQKQSQRFVFTCATDAKGVIAGAFFGVLFFVILVCAVVFIMLRRPDLIGRRKKPLIGGGRTSVIKSKKIPLEKFPAHFTELSADENKGFSLEYEDLSLVDTDQSQKAANVQENKPKNRFINVLPYDRSRVKLTSAPHHSDYINASFMPGYNSDREFIAAQGPLPSTVNDFWRMVWEQKVSGIVMVTNCTEGGRTKCDQYWPNSNNSRVCGDWVVFTTSEQKHPDWTLREFTIKHKHTSEERTVKHFHFTAWPDHGVPEGTEVLIQFRALVRKHIQMEAAGAPTVVHCSAGVGRTGTIIALDMLLQQMENEKAVDINGFVHKMRLNRPHMVQTESQYVFLHQCVLDRLRVNDSYEENIYENENDLIYANATALQEYQNSLNKA